ncbi:hypothetical protein K2173_018679 [Erythroxylum novogranatense]|uniref:Peroxisomal membrane protein n=1 Tax=Erythroxylum novogranatense TaxID=1862640 RepID=A0AAV8SB09_9ROSI|nr:hypothetical protein K2173_018679 [Erythroxylum novogranatense]
MASLNAITTRKLSTKLTNPIITTPSHIRRRHPSSVFFSTIFNPSNYSLVSTHQKRNLAVVVGAVTDDTEVVPVEDTSSEDKANSSPSSSVGERIENEVDHLQERLISRSINATIVLGFGTLVITKLLTIDHDYWHGWTLYEVIMYAPVHNWVAYEEALKENPVLAKMAISGIVYSIGDWIAQCYEGKSIFEFERMRMFRSGLVGFALHGSLSHYYYQLCEALLPTKSWWVVLAKAAVDQTVWAAVWNSIYFVLLGFLRLESPANIFAELRRTFWPVLTAGWKLWPFAHLITYGVIPLEQRLLWVDCVELIWVTILSTYSNEKKEAQISDATIESKSLESTPEE